MRKASKHQAGLSIIEFTLVSTVLLMVIFGVFEVGRYMYSLQLINEATRIAARLGVVCRVKERDNIPALVVPTPLAGGFSSSNLSIDYLDQNGAVVDIDVSSEQAENDTYSKIYYVRARVTNFVYQFSGVLSFLGEGISIPNYETVRPRENLGYLRADGNDPTSDYTEC